MKAVLDTNFLMMPAQFKINIYEEIGKNIPDVEFVTSERVVEELEMLGENASKLAIRLLKHNGVKVEAMGKPADEKLMDYAYKNGAVLCTNDRELRQKALEKGVTVMFMRSKKKIEMMRP